MILCEEPSINYLIKARVTIELCGQGPQLPPPPTLLSALQARNMKFILLILSRLLPVHSALIIAGITLHCYSSHHTGQRMTHCAHSAQRDNLFLANINS